ncbi:MAG: 1-deoxy-D-xylulose-5-phosphate reductoisomerase [Desulfatitalea sp.]|nr:1-deoxy-D-xylulose-5-phosphate reductoisomerase [Desulfatitalea sp.]NNK02314.1 1-deoxy-D-xylulose-5-phosphate reductoisomerase [Desulfatitalea sp.]
MKSLAILGATGSIGNSTLKIVKKFPDRFTVKALAAKNNVDRLSDQILAFQPRLAVVYDEASAVQLQQRLQGRCAVEILYGSEGYAAAAALPDVDMVVGAMVGAAGLAPTMAAIEAGKDIALANKETLVMAGHLVTQAVKTNNVRLLPVDSEHSAIFQCLQGERIDRVDQLIITASGGPFRELPANRFSGVTPEEALKHPNWQMGEKITIDSATLMNKGLEVIEARWLFDMAVDRIQVLVHPQSIVHSMVAFCDGSVMAQMGIPDMQQAIAYALAYPDRLGLQQPLPDFSALGCLTFEPPDLKRFPCLRLAFEACRTGGTLPAVLNAANEVAVSAFLSGKIGFSHIPVIIEETMAACRSTDMPDLAAILADDEWARQKAKRKVDQFAAI